MLLGGVGCGGAYIDVYGGGAGGYIVYLLVIFGTVPHIIFNAI